MNWRIYARCRDIDPEIFFEPRKYEQAKEVCSGCPVQIPCLNDGILQDKELSHSGVLTGVWGGLTPEERSPTGRARVRRGRVA
jgi:WhiB family transcriptional regulator, redox-sensing transcriptional regulator